MGRETQKRPFHLSFNSSLRIEFQGAHATSDCDLILVRALDERQSFSELIERHLSDSRRAKNTQLSLAELLGSDLQSLGRVRTILQLVLPMGIETWLLTTRNSGW
jgi:hypothetical protein